MSGQTRKSRGTAVRASPSPIPSSWRPQEGNYASRRTKPEQTGKSREGRQGSPHLCVQVVATADTPACGNSLELDMERGITTAL